MKTGQIWIGFLLLGVLLSGCETKVADPSADDYGFERTALGTGGTFAIRDDKALEGYHSIYLRAIVATPSDQVGSVMIDQSEMANLEYAFERSFRSTVGSTFPVVSAPGEGIMLVEATVDEVMLADGRDQVEAADNAEMNGPDSLDGGAMDGVGMPQVAGSSLAVGELTLRLQIRDSLTGDLLASMTDDAAGGTIESINGETSWARVSDAFNRWNNDLKAELVAVTK
ncbi:MAG: DUF3313 family protein [Verrucomicrobiota bacterium]